MKLPELPDYKLEERIGEGICGYVFRCSFHGGEQRAIKFLKAQAVNPGLVSTCFRALANRDPHPGLARIHAHHFASLPYFYIMPLYGRRDAATGEWASDSLGQYLGALTADHSLRLIDQMADALAYLHRCEVIHAGLKPNNIFVTGQAETGYQAVVTDCGQGYVTGLQYLEMGDIGFYAAPEQLDNGDPSGGAGKRWDVYSFGVVCYQLLTGQLPRLEKRYREFRRDIISHVPATAFGSVLEHAERYVDWLVEEEKIQWPGEPASESEAKRREIVSRCLALDPRDRYPDMRDVSAALSEADHDLTLVRIERSAREDRERARSRVRKWRIAAYGAAVLSVLGILAAVAFLFKWQTAVGKVGLTENQRNLELQKMSQAYNADIEAATKQAAEKARTQAAMEVAGKAEEQQERLRQEALKQIRLGWNQFREAQENGDKFFDMVLESRDSDLPGFAEKRRQRLAEAVPYYESLLHVYGDEPDFNEPAAKALRYLGEIHYELGDYEKASQRLYSAEIRLLQIRQQNADRPDVATALARVKRREAEIESRRGKIKEALAALADSTEFWAQLRMQNPADREVAVEVARNRLLEAQIRLADPADANAARAALAGAVQVFVQLRADFPGDDRVIGGLARATLETARLLDAENQVKEAEAAYGEAAELFADAVRLNATVDEYQAGLGESLGRVAVMLKDDAKLLAAAKVLAEVAARDPGRGEIPKILADCFGALARKQRDGKQAAAALKLEEQAIAFLEPLVIGTPNLAPAMTRFALAERKHHYADLLIDGKKLDEARQALSGALELLAPLRQTEPLNPDYHRLNAHAEGLLGCACNLAGDKTAARQHYEAARQQWQTYATSHPEDDQAPRNAEWAAEQLKAMN